MKSNLFFKHYALIILLLVLTCLVCVLIFTQSSLAEMILFIMTVISVWIAILAYHISMKTYVSIDAVNAISRMDGNVMENEGYRTNIAAHVRQFNALDREQAGKDLIDHIKSLFNINDNISGARLADNIQEVINVLVLLPFIVNSIDDKYAEKNRVEIELLLSKIKHKVDTYEKMSEGSCVLMKESVKLIEAVFSYQKLRSLDAASDCHLMDVRGAMLKNAVSRTVYYNYMGLLYLTKAIESILRHLNIIMPNSAIYKITTLQALKKRCVEECPEVAVAHLKMAMHYFRLALDMIKDDIMWNAFINFNLARVEFLLNTISNNTMCPNWVDTFDSAINYRKHLNLMLKDILGLEEYTYFQRAFVGEEYKARFLKIACEIVAHRDITNAFGKVIVDQSAYDQVAHMDCIKQAPKDEFNLFKGHLDDILDYLKTAKTTETVNQRAS